MPLRVPVDREALAQICRKYGIRKLSLFGSVLRDDFGPESDIDVLVDFEPDASIGFEIFALERELSALFGGRKVDVLSEKYLNRRLRPYIMGSAKVQYEAA